MTAARRGDRGARRGAGPARCRRRRSPSSRSRATIAARWSMTSPAFAITGGRHPVVEAALAPSRPAASSPTTAISATAQRLWLVTGPNMAGKSTFLRQNALIAMLAQIGSFVPARGRPYRRRRPPVQPRRRRRRSRPRPLHLHGRDGGDRGDPQPGEPALARDPRRDRPRHRDLRRPLHRLGDGRASARGQPLPRPVRHPLSRADGARRAAAGALAPCHAGQGMAGRGGVPA